MPWLQLGARSLCWGVPLCGTGGGVCLLVACPLLLPSPCPSRQRAKGWLEIQWVGASHSLWMQPPRIPMPSPTDPPPTGSFPRDRGAPPPPPHLPEGLLQLEVEHALLHHRLLHLPATSILLCCPSAAVPPCPTAPGGSRPGHAPLSHRSAAVATGRVVSACDVRSGSSASDGRTAPAPASCASELTIKGSGSTAPPRLGLDFPVCKMGQEAAPRAAPLGEQPPSSADLPTPRHHPSPTQCSR